MDPRMVALLAAVALAGSALVSTVSPAVAIAQALLPTPGGTAAGLMVGFAVGGRGAGGAAPRALADHWGLRATMHAPRAVSLAAAP